MEHLCELSCWQLYAISWKLSPGIIGVNFYHIVIKWEILRLKIMKTLVLSNLYCPQHFFTIVLCGQTCKTGLGDAYCPRRMKIVLFCSAWTLPRVNFWCGFLWQHKLIFAVSYNLAVYTSCYNLLIKAEQRVIFVCILCEVFEKGRYVYILKMCRLTIIKWTLLSDKLWK